MEDNPFFNDPVADGADWSYPAPDHDAGYFQPEADAYTPPPEVESSWSVSPDAPADPGPWADPFRPADGEPQPFRPAPEFVSPEGPAFDPSPPPDPSPQFAPQPFEPGVLPPPDAWQNPYFVPPEAEDILPTPQELAPALWEDATPADAAAQWYTPEVNWDASQFDGVGDPASDAPFWNEQQGENACAVVAQMSILESITGRELSEEAVARYAQEQGWYDPQTGTLPGNVGNILNAFGVPTEQKTDATLVDIAEALERGDKVIVGLDALEVWQPVRDAAGQPVEQTLPSGGDAGHAVWVTGIDQQPDGSVKLILNDSGTPDGQMKAVDAYDFVNAWSDYGNFLVVAHPPTPPTA